MPSKHAERDDAVLNELRHINTAITDLKAQLITVSHDLSQVRIADLTDVRASVARIDGDLKVLQYQSRRSGAWGGMFAGAGVSAIVAALAALLLRH